MNEDKREFYGCLQRLLDNLRIESKVRGLPISTMEFDHNMFLYKGTLHEARGVSTIHIDLMHVAMQGASLTM